MWFTSWSLLVAVLPLSAIASLRPKVSVIEGHEKVPYPIRFAFCHFNTLQETPSAALGFMDIFSAELPSYANSKEFQEITIEQVQSINNFLTRSAPSKGIAEAIVRVLNRSRYFASLGIQEFSHHQIQIECVLTYIHSLFNNPILAAKEDEVKRLVMDQIVDIICIMQGCGLNAQMKADLARQIFDILGHIKMPNPISNHDTFALDDKNPFSKKSFDFVTIDRDALFEKFLKVLKACEENGFGHLEAIIRSIFMDAQEFERSIDGRNVAMIDANVTSTSFQQHAFKKYSQQIEKDPLLEAVISIFDMVMQRSTILKTLRMESLNAIIQHPFEAMNHIRSANAPFALLYYLLSLQFRMETFMQRLLGTRYFTDCKSIEPFIRELEKSKKEYIEVKEIFVRFENIPVPTNIPIRVNRYFEHAQWYPYVLMTCLDSIVQDPLSACILRIHFDREFVNMLSAVRLFPGQDRPRIDAQNKLLQALAAFPPAKTILSNYFATLNEAVTKSYFKISVDIATRMQFSSSFTFIIKQFAMLAAIMQERPDDNAYHQFLLKSIMNDISYLKKYRPLSPSEAGYVEHMNSKMTFRIAELQVIEAARPKVVSKQEREADCTQLNLYLKKLNYFESDEEEAARNRVFNIIRDIAQSFVQHLSKKQINEGNAVTYFGDLLQFGSVSLGVNAGGSDNDLILIAPSFVTCDEFYNLFAQMLKECKELNLESINICRGAYVPVMTLNAPDCQVDIVFANVDVPMTAEALIHDDIRFQVNRTSLHSLSGFRATEAIKNIVPVESQMAFRGALRTIKMWADRRGIYGNVYGYLNGVACAIMVAYICKANPHDAANVIVQKFFHTFSKRSWPDEAVLLKEIRYDSQYPSSWVPIRPGVEIDMMPVVTPIFPAICTTHNITLSTREVVLRELRRAAELFKPSPVGNPSYELLMKSSRNEFFSDHEYFLMVVGVCPEKNELKEEKNFSFFKSGIKSKIRNLAKFSCEPYGQAKRAIPYPGSFTMDARGSDEFSVLSLHEPPNRANQKKNNSSSNSSGQHQLPKMRNDDNVSKKKGNNSNSTKRGQQSKTFRSAAFYIALKEKDEQPSPLKYAQTIQRFFSDLEMALRNGERRGTFSNPQTEQPEFMKRFKKAPIGFIKVEDMFVMVKLVSRSELPDYVMSQTD